MRHLSKRYKSIECFFNEQAYYFSDGHTVFKYFRARSDDPGWSVYSDYQKQYMILIDLMKKLIEEGSQNVVVHNYSRIVEEVNLVIKPMNKWGRSALIYLSRNVFPYLVDMSFVKMSQDDIITSLMEGKLLIESYEGSPIDVGNAINNIQSQRLDRFRNEQK